ncbi:MULTISPECIES: iron-containing alcohol dehydrogenase family protein [Bacillaceae]|uniref:Glycerol dehydrogenase n=1 Tax=Alkalicoccobacillus plakortidis TaxID=444060 RepID=A0A9D5DSA8_9BACI|nr:MULTISPECIES: iron-containing alcohol dehydrogenase family protein [Bacillaceae]KQL57136.1 glycerol dehydrogenase [Alkalicoccobacillus plakortidis]
MSSLIVRGAPQEYVFAEGALSELEERLLARKYKRVLVVHGHASWQAIASFWPELKEVEATYEAYAGQCTVTEMKRLADRALDGNFDALIGVGGGTLLDTVKGAAHLLSQPYLLIPTLASNCAPWTPISVIYNEEGVYTHFDVYEQNASLLLVDPHVLLTTPRAFFLAGIGDTLAKWYEADVQLRAITDKRAALDISYYAAQLCQSVLLEKSEESIKSLADKKGSSAFCKVVEAIIMLGGMVGGFGDKYGRIAGAHSIHNGLTAIKETHDVLHGNKVAYGILVQLALEKKWNEIEQLIPFYYKVELPTSLVDLGINVGSADLNAVCKRATMEGESIHVMPGVMNAGDVRKAIDQIEEINKNRPV